MEQTEEKDLVERARRDPDAFGALFDRYHAKIYSYALRRVGSPSAADDIASEVFHKALLKLWQFKWQGAPFSAWLYRIATNEINLHFRKASSKNVSLEALTEETGFEPASSYELRKELEEAEAELERHALFLRVREEIARLPLAYQEALALRFFEGKKIEEISEILGKKTGTVKSLLSRGLEKLRSTCNLPEASDIMDGERSPFPQEHNRRP